MANFSLSDDCGFHFFYLYLYFYLFSLLVSPYPFLTLLFGHFVNFPTLKTCFASYCSDFKKFILFIFSLFKNFGEILLFYCTVFWIVIREI